MLVVSIIRIRLICNLYLLMKISPRPRRQSTVKRENVAAEIEGQCHVDAGPEKSHREGG